LTAALLVLIFVSTDCPVSNRYAPEIQRLYREFGPRGVHFELVYPNPNDNTSKITAHLSAYGYPAITAIPDPNQRLAESVGAKITPEAAVLDSTKRLLYRGRIDNRFVELGRERPAPTTHDLRDALIAALSAKPIDPPRTQAVGCFIADMTRRR
jgi:redoxin